MSTVSRRILIYWLLLLVPTVLAGVGAVGLLRREQSRLAERVAETVESRRAAVTARAGLIAENAALLAGDMRLGLIETLAGLPGADLDAGLEALERANPLVRTAFRCALSGRVLWPPEDVGGAAGEAGRGFRRRLAGVTGGTPPWRAEGDDSGVSVAPQTASPPASLSNAPEMSITVQQQMFSNNKSFETGRKDVQAASKARDGYIYRSQAPVSEVGDRKREAATGATRKETAAAPGSDRREGWIQEVWEGRLCLIGWVALPGAGEVRGVEIAVAEWVAWMGAALPMETLPGEGYVLADETGKVLHQTGRVPADRSGPVARLGLPGDSLPGWQVLGFLEGPVGAGGLGASRGFFLLGSLLAVILGVAILAGGFLLMSQARRSAEEATQRASFVANVSHEFKTPLTTIRLYAELLEQGRVQDADRRSEYLRTIGRETERLARLVGNALEFSRLEQGRKRFALEPMDLGAELERLMSVQRPRLEQAGLRVELVIPDEPVRVSADRDAFEQIILNLLENGVKYAASGGELRVELSAGKGGSGAVVRVSDRGPGVPVEQRERVFEKFHRVDERLTAGQTGTGLGLSIARQLARGMGGDVRCEPREGGGTVFVLELP